MIKNIITKLSLFLSFSIFNAIFCAEIKNSNFSQCRFNNADMRMVDGINCNYTQAIFDDADLEDANMSDSNFINASFKRSNLKYGEFHNSNFKYSKFIDANLKGANFSGCIFKKAKFKNVKFDKKTNFKNANLEGTRINPEELLNAHLENTIMPDGSLYCGEPLKAEKCVEKK